MSGEQSKAFSRKDAKRAKKFQYVLNLKYTLLLLPFFAAFASGLF
jgi:hypothetical protein